MKREGGRGRRRSTREGEGGRGRGRERVKLEFIQRLRKGGEGACGIRGRGEAGRQKVEEEMRQIERERHFV